MSDSDRLKLLLHQIEKNIRFVHGWCQRSKPEKNEKFLTGSEKWVTVKFCEMAKEFHHSIENNDINMASRILYDFWFQIITRRKSGNG